MPISLHILGFLLLIQGSLAGQNTQLILKKFEGSKQISEQYFVLKSNKMIKNGPYLTYFRLNEAQNKRVKHNVDSLQHYVKQTGFYENGKKSGEWIEYIQPGVFYAKGAYREDKKVDIWIISRENGEVIEHFDFDHNKRLEPDIRIPVQYPEKSRNSGAEGTVSIEYEVTNDCTLANIKTVQSVSPDCDLKAVTILQKYFRYLRQYGTTDSCIAKTDIFKVTFHLE